MTEVNDKVEKLNKFFEEDAYVKMSGIEIVEVTDEYAVVAADIGSQHLNANGCVQGGMLYTMADFAFAVISNALHPVTVTQGGRIDYLRPGICKKITATAREKARAGRNTVCEVVIQDDQGETLCLCTFNGFVKDIEKI